MDNEQWTEAWKFARYLLLVFHYSLSLFAVHYSLFIVHYSLEKRGL